MKKPGEAVCFARFSVRLPEALSRARPGWAAEAAAEAAEAAAAECIPAAAAAAEAAEAAELPQPCGRT